MNVPSGRSWEKYNDDSLIVQYTDNNFLQSFKNLAGYYQKVDIGC